MVEDFSDLDLEKITDPDLISRVIKSKSTQAKLELIYNKNLTDDELIALATVSNVQGRAEIASIDSPQELLVRLLGDKSAKVRVEALANPAIDVETFRGFILGDEFSLPQKRKLASCWNAIRDFETFTYLWGIDDYELICTLNEAVGVDGNLNQQIVTFAEENILTASVAAKVTFATALHYNWASIESLESLKDDRSLDVIKRLAANPRASGIHKYIADKYKQESVQLILANKSLDGLLLEDMCNVTKSSKVRNAILGNSAYTVDSPLANDIKKARGIVYGNIITAEEWDFLSNSPDVEVKMILSQRTDIPEHVLSKFTSDSSTEVQTAALLNVLADNSAFKEIVFNGKLRLQDKRRLCESVHALAHLDVFQYLWSFNGFDALLVRAIGQFLTEGHEGIINQQVIGFVATRIRNASNQARIAYADDIEEWTDPQILDVLKFDKHPEVIDNLASNPRTLPTTHHWLLSRYDSTRIMTSIAIISRDSKLLNRLYYETKNQTIKELVLNNPDFELEDHTSSEWIDYMNGWNNKFIYEGIGLHK